MEGRLAEREREKRVDNPSLTTGAAPEAPSEGRRRRGLDHGLRGALVVSGVALLIHLIPLFLPRNMPEQELAIARVLPNAEQRAPFLLPLREHPKATPAELREAAELLLEGAPAEARELAQEAERRDPNAVETQLLLARICDVERMDRCVSSALERAARLAPADARPDLLRAELQEKDGDVAGAAKSLGRAHGKTPADPLVGLRYARLLSAAKRGDEARRVLHSLEGQVPRARLLVEQGRVWTAEGRDAEAAKLFQKATEEDPKLAIAFFELGLAWHRLGNAEVAEEALRQADKLDLESPKALAAMCAMQLEEGRISDARLTRMDLERRFSGREELIRQSCSIP
ncbi:lipopolysaccharide assembly protein LapB [Myxococcus sp. RHSTA-1-4]|uniref:tetratricopeptide repeat protein n=1 Tax=Myxococcus sp. RHSTA-1-4 TaxID=2874601 RepID=UPI001CBFD6CA|nr:tetratricopeptide repeat protein [Myxococcus sp. RHSTA-1-4]MBZ4422641.1 tetratricopeptide repeat protein [Myxococcus sp. RHSTA-1-4]